MPCSLAPSSPHSLSSDLPSSQFPSPPPPPQVQKQVHPRLEIDDDAVAYLEELIYHLLAQMCAAQPHSLADVESYVQQNLTAPIDTWALNEAKELMEKLAQKKKGVFAFPVDKIFQQLQKVCMHAGLLVTLSSW